MVSLQPLGVLGTKREFTPLRKDSQLIRGFSTFARGENDSAQRGLSAYEQEFEPRVKTPTETEPAVIGT
jgi:hypothetical protein